MRTTFLGHHSWIFSHGESSVLVDPLFDSNFGFVDSVGLTVFPPRTIAIDRLPRFSAIVLTHDHEGHFDVRSFMKIDRSTPVWIPGRSSVAVQAILEELGFAVHRLAGGKPVRFGGLELHPWYGDHVRFDSLDEWDVVAYLMRDLDGHGSFFSAVDLHPTERMTRAVREIVKRPGLWSYTNNANDNPYQYSWRSPSRHVIKDHVAYVAKHHFELRGFGMKPPASLLVGGGFCFRGEQAWLNAETFTCTNQQLARALEHVVPDHRFVAPEPGDCFAMVDGELRIERDDRLIAETFPRPERGVAGKLDWLERYSPATGREDLTEPELDALMVELDAFAVDLYGKERFKVVMSLTEDAAKGKKPTFALMLLAGRAEDGEPEAYVFEYDPTSCSFNPVACSDPVGEYCAVLECWASDMLDTLTCVIPMTALYFGRCRMWNAAPRAFRFDPMGDLIKYTHGLRHPERTLMQYRRLAGYKNV